MAGAGRSFAQEWLARYESIQKNVFMSWQSIHPWKILFTIAGLDWFHKVGDLQGWDAGIMPGVLLDPIIVIWISPLGVYIIQLWTEDIDPGQSNVQITLISLWELAFRPVVLNCDSRYTSLDKRLAHHVLWWAFFFQALCFFGRNQLFWDLNNSSISSAGRGLLK